MALIYEVPTHLNVEDTLFSVSHRDSRFAFPSERAWPTLSGSDSPLVDGARGRRQEHLCCSASCWGCVSRLAVRWTSGSWQRFCFQLFRGAVRPDCSTRNDHVGSSPDWAELSPIPAWLRPAATDLRADHDQPRDGRSVHWRWPR
jgi:hypothetical protein